MGGAGLPGPGAMGAGRRTGTRLVTVTFATKTVTVDPQQQD
jgi:hypothetical protein